MHMMTSKLPMGEPSFIMNSGAPAGVSNIEHMFKIVKIDTDGNVLDSFQCEITTPITRSACL